MPVYHSNIVVGADHCPTTTRGVGWGTQESLDADLMARGKQIQDMVEATTNLVTKQAELGTFQCAQFVPFRFSSYHF